MKLKKKIVSVFFSIKILDPFFFELLIDSIKDCNKNLKINKKTLFLFTIYLNILSTKKLNIQQQKIYIDPKIANNDLVYSLAKHTSLSIVDIMNKESKPPLKKFLFNNLYSNMYNELLTSQVLISSQIIKNLDKI